MPALTELQMAVCRASLLRLVQFAFEVVTEPEPPRLMLATRMPLAAALSVTHSTPQMTDAQEPFPNASRTFTATRPA